MYPILFIHACMSLEALVSTGSRSLRRSTSSKRSVQWPQAGRRMRAVHERVGKIWDPDTITHLICNGFRKAVRRTCFWFGVSIPWHEDLVKWSQIAELHKDIEHLFHWTLRERWLFFQPPSGCKSNFLAISLQSCSMQGGHGETNLFMYWVGKSNWQLPTMPVMCEDTPLHNFNCAFQAAKSKERQRGLFYYVNMTWLTGFLILHIKYLPSRIARVKINMKS